MRSRFVIVAIVALLLVGAVAPSALAQDALGSEGNPIQVYFVPSVEAGVIVSGGEVMA